MSDQFVNPITASFALVERYKSRVRTNLCKSVSLPDDEIDHVMHSLALDQKLYFALNRSYQPGQQSFRQFCDSNGLAAELADLFYCIHRLHQHQEDAIRSVLDGRATIVSTGTGSGKTETFLIPILDHCLKHPGDGVKAFIIYPTNALANDQVRRIGEVANGLGISYGLFTGGTSDDERHGIRIKKLPDILITNYVMLDWMLTRSEDQRIFERSRETLCYIVLDEIHTYRGNKATHLKYLLARLRARLAHFPVQIGTSATLEKGSSNTGGESSAARDRFIRDLLEVEEFSFIQPNYKSDVNIEPI